MGQWLADQRGLHLQPLQYLGSGNAARDTQLGIVDGAKVIGQPENTLVLSADWQGANWNFGLSGRYLGTRYLDAANVNKLPSATVFNANIGSTCRACRRA